VLESLGAEAHSYYEEHSASLPGGEEQARQIERELMLRVIDQKWREHLADMDYLRDGIHLRAVAQQDPLVAWQREGFDMFGRLMDAIDDDYLKYVMHVEAVTAQAPEVDLNRATYEAADDPVTGTAILAGQLLADRGVDVAAVRAAENRAAAAASGRAVQGSRPSVAAGARGANPAAQGRSPQPTRPAQPARPSQALPAEPSARPDAAVRNASPAPARTPDKVGRNDPCYCGSGKKYKLCHGAA
jgi:preprotein translocase subunit SecA